MTIPVCAFFNNKGGVGKTSLVYHLAWMYADQGRRIVAADLDPQANLTAMFVDEGQLELLWEARTGASTIYQAVRPLERGVGDIAEARLEDVGDRLWLLAGDLALSGFEDDLSSQWTESADRKERAFRVMSAFWRVLQASGRAVDADLILVDLGPNLGAINRAALLASHYVAIPLSPDLFSLQGLRNLGPTLRDWRGQWQVRLHNLPADMGDLSLPPGDVQPAGYIVMQHSVRLDRPVRAYDKWIQRIPREYHASVLDEGDEPPARPDDDPACLALLKHYRSLMPLAQEARKPMFHLTAADGAIGAHGQAVSSCREDFARLAQDLAERIGLPPS